METHSHARYRKWVGCAAALAIVLLCSVILVRRQPARLTIETSAAGGQVVYDTGYGDMLVQPSASETLPGGWKRLVFPLPNATILRLRFEPAGQVPASAGIRSALVWTAERLDRVFTPADFETPSGSQIRVKLQRPLHLRRVITSANLRLAGVAAGSVLLLAGVVIAALPTLAKPLNLLRRLGTAVDGRFAAWAVRLSSGRFLRLDSLALWFVACCGLSFAFSVVADLNGSAVSLHQSFLGHGAKTRLLIGIAHGVRADEWGYSTPDILNQATRAQRFAVAASPLGNHFIALTGNVPVRHFSALFRPQLWGFFVLPLTYAFSFYWQAKALILVTGVFLLLLLVTASSRWAAVGSLWYFFSPCIQWCYSWPSALPEMIGMASLATVCWCYLAVGRNTWKLALAVAGAVTCSVDFAMCAYLPHLIPLFWLAVTVVLCWCAAHHREILDPRARGKRATAVICALAVLVLVGMGVYADLGTAIRLVSETVYPGRRLIPSGSFSAMQFTSHLFQWVEAETYIPAALTNICEASGFLWFAPLTLLIAPQLSLTRTRKIFLAGFWAFFAGNVAWLLLPLPTALGALTGYDRVLAPRALPALGLANVAIVCLSLTGLNRQLLTKRLWITAWIASSIAAVALLLWTNRLLDHYFSGAEVFVCGLLWTLLTVLFFSGRKREFAAILMVLCAFSFGVVNPVQRGLDVFTRSSMMAFLNLHPKLRNGPWLVYSEVPFDSGFFAAMGCETYTGTRYLPDVDHFALFRSRGLDLNAVNRLGYVKAKPASAGTPTAWTVPSPWETEWQIAPTDPLLAQIGIRYVAFAVRPDASIVAGLSPLAPGPVDGFWLYSLPRPPAFRRE